MESRTNTSLLQVGDRLSRVSYMEIISTDSKSCRVKNQDGLVWTIANTVLENEASTANQYVEERKVSRTEMISALEHAGDSVFTVVFGKKVSQKDIASDITSLQKDEGFVNMSKREIDAMAKKLLGGTERTLVGYLASTEPKMGRSTVVDLLISPDQHQLRLVDHRTITELILQNVRYILKS